MYPVYVRSLRQRVESTHDTAKTPKNASTEETQGAVVFTMITMLSIDPFELEVPLLVPANEVLFFRDFRFGHQSFPAPRSSCLTWTIDAAVYRLVEGASGVCKFRLPRSAAGSLPRDGDLVDFGGPRESNCWLVEHVHPLDAQQVHLHKLMGEYGYYIPPSWSGLSKSFFDHNVARWILSAYAHADFDAECAEFRAGCLAANIDSSDRCFFYGSNDLALAPEPGSPFVMRHPVALDAVQECKAMADRRKRAMAFFDKLSASLLYLTMRRRLPRGVCGIIAKFCKMDDDVEPLSTLQLGMTRKERAEGQIARRQASIPLVAPLRMRWLTFPPSDKAIYCAVYERNMLVFKQHHLDVLPLNAALWKICTFSEAKLKLLSEQVASLPWETFLVPVQNQSEAHAVLAFLEGRGRDVVCGTEMCLQSGAVNIILLPPREMVYHVHCKAKVSVVAICGMFDIAVSSALVSNERLCFACSFENELVDTMARKEPDAKCGSTHDGIEFLLKHGEHSVFL